MKVVLSNKCYFNYSIPELWEHCSLQTTYQIEKVGSQFPIIYKNSARMGERLCFIPVTRLDLLENWPDLELEIVDKRIQVSAEIPKPSFILRKGVDGSIDQQEIYDAVEGTCLINGNPGFGKTITALGLAYKFQQKTLVICTNVSIREQWEAEIKKWFGFTPGIIGSGKYDIEPPIVVSNIQTLNKHTNLLTKEFGVVIVDEVHHCVATTFSNFLNYSHAKIKIGLSGTLKRKDGLNVMFKDFFGTEVHIPTKNNVMEPVVHLYKCDLEFNGNKAIPWATRVNDLYEEPEYLEHMIAKCYQYWKIGHKVLFVCDRTDILDTIEELLHSVDVPVFKITGKIDNRLAIQEEVASSEPCVLLATQSIFAEGISLNELSCLVIGTLLNNESLVEQLVGRIQRIVPGKTTPIVVDTEFKGITMAKQSRERRSVYINNGWETIKMTPEAERKFLKNVFAEQ